VKHLRVEHNILRGALALVGFVAGCSTPPEPPGPPARMEAARWFFVVTVGKGTLSSTYANTNALGIATVSWTLGTDPGPNWMIGSVAAWERSLLYFKATGTPP
jgi:hypothetical protein